MFIKIMRTGNSIRQQGMQLCCDKRNAHIGCGALHGRLIPRLDGHVLRVAPETIIKLRSPELSVPLQPR